MVVWTRTAKRDLRAIFDFISHDSRSNALKMVELILEKSNLLTTHPFMGRKVPEVKRSRIREIQVQPYRLIYEVQVDEIQILAIIHSRRSFLLTWKNRQI